MSQQDNIEAARANFEAISKQDKDLWDRIHAPDYLGEEPGVPEAMNVEQHWMFLMGMTTAFPDNQFEFTRTIATGDYVVVHWTVTGTHNGPLPTPTGDSIPATGKKVVLKGSSTFELRDGKLTREWGFFDNASILAQLGLMPG
jgi:steroid delta-isomerase-like uncharacterized protein